jgi:hypothetical protein
MKRFNGKGILLAVVAASVSLGTTRVGYGNLPFHTFNTDGQGWRIAGANTDYGPPTVVDVVANWDSQGNPGGSLVVSDNFYSTWISAPAPFLGNQSSMYGKSFTYDLLIAATDNVAYPSAAIYDGTTYLLYTLPPPPNAQWQTRTVTFNESLWRVGDGNTGPVATQAQLQTVLANLTGLYLLTEWHTGGDDTNIDNVGVRLSAIPGDFDSDGDVDGADFVAWQTNFPKPSGATLAQGDADSDGDVDGADFVVWQTNFPYPPSPAVVPEPSAIGLALLSVPALVFLRHRLSIR